ncbi:MAG: ABC transporter permease, partial [Acidimicrobiales bacterium]
PSPWNDDIVRYLPGEAGTAVFQVVRDNTNGLSAWAGFGVLCAYVVAALVVGAVLLDRRDA